MFFMACLKVQTLKHEIRVLIDRVEPIPTEGHLSGKGRPADEVTARNVCVAIVTFHATVSEEKHRAQPADSPNRSGVTTSRLRGLYLCAGGRIRGSPGGSSRFFARRLILRSISIPPTRRSMPIFFLAAGARMLMTLR